jgi:hypothetical protein
LKFCRAKRRIMTSIDRRTRLRRCHVEALRDPEELRAAAAVRPVAASEARNTGTLAMVSFRRRR